MPYTPPSAQSPSSSRTSTPAISRNASYSEEVGLIQSPASIHRPNLPRSVSSTAYLNKHRRSPSVTSPTTPSIGDAQYGRLAVVRDAESLSSLRQSPPPVNNLVIPTGAILSPPDSLENSDGDESNERSARRREVENTWNELQQAVRSMSIKRETSPSKGEKSQRASEPHTQVTFPTSLSAAARKISHSRSSTDTAIKGPFTESHSRATSSDESEDDQDRPSKPPLVRKKSGELVKPALRPSSRRRYSSMPGTPTYSKSVHFNDNGNQTRHFLQVDKPSAVSANTSPAETAYESENEFPFDARSSKVEWDIKLTNFPENKPERQLKPIWVERIFLSADNKTLIGQVAVANICFHKSVAARFTLDYWKTTSEVAAEYSHDVRKQNAADGYDRFTFSIRLVDQANLESKTLLLCVRYSVIGQEHWDNNDGTNFQIDFSKKITKAQQHAPKSLLGARPLNAIPRSRHSPPASRGRARAPSFDDEMSRGNGPETSSTYHFGQSTQDLLIDDSQTTIKLKPRSKRSNMFPPGQPQPTGGLGGRYDFGASLSAALVNAQDKLGKQSGLLGKPHQASRQSSSYFTREAAAEERQPSPERLDALTTDRPAMGSAQYKDLVSKFCYFTPASGAKLSPNPVTNAQPAKNATDTEGADEMETTDDSGDSTPSPPRSMSPMLDGTNERSVQSPQYSPFTSRSGSPGPRARKQMSSRTHSPVKYGYPFKRDGYLSDSPAPTAIQG